MGMRMRITCAAIGLQLLKRREPAVDSRVRLAQRKAFEISQRRVHSLHVRDEHQVSRARRCALRGLRIQPGTSLGRERVLHLSCHCLKLVAGLKLLAFVQARCIARCTRPGTATVQGHAKRARVGHPWERRRAQRSSSASRMRSLSVRRRHPVQVPEHSRWNQGCEPRPGAVTTHGDLADPIRNPAKFQPKPNLLAIGAPGVVIAKQRDAHRRFRLTKQTKRRLRIGRSFNTLRSRRCHGFQFRPAQSSGGIGFNHDNLVSPLHDHRRSESPVTIDHPSRRTLKTWPVTGALASDARTSWAAGN